MEETLRTVLQAAFRRRHQSSELAVGFGDRSSLSTLERIVSLSSKDVLVPSIRLQIRSAVLNPYAWFRIVLFFFALTPPVPLVAGSWLTLPAAHPIPYDFRGNWLLVQPQ